MTLSDMLNGNHTEKEVSWLPCWDIGLPLLIPPPHPSTPALSAVLKSVAVLFINLADALASSCLAGVPPVLGSPCLLLPSR